MPTSPPPLTLDAIASHAISRTLFPPTTLARAIDKLGFVQVDPIAAPARAQDLILRHRVRGYVAGDLERRYPRLAVEEDHLVNYGVLPRRLMALMHPRTAKRPWSAEMEERAARALAFIRERGPTHPRELEAEMSLGRAMNPWGRQSNATTLLLDGMHHRGLLRVATRQANARVYEAVSHPPCDDSPAARLTRARALFDVAMGLYSPVPARGLTTLAYFLSGGAPQLRAELRAIARSARGHYGHGEVGGSRWFWLADEDPSASGSPSGDDDTRVLFLAPFDPIVWDRRRFEMLWGWAYRFEAYTPAPKRKRGYYALPLLWRNQVIGWGNIAVESGSLDVDIGYAGKRPRSRAFTAGLDAEIERMRRFLGLINE